MVHQAIASAKLKVQRAKSHLMELDDFLTQYVKPDLHRVTLEQNSPIWSVKCRLQSEPMIEAIPLAFGDCVHNLRAALDHALMAFVPEGIAATQVHFPFNETREGLISTFTAPGYKGPIKALSADVWTIITDQIRPYRDAEDAGLKSDGLLWTLNKLDNIDKHRALILTAGVSEITFISLTTTGGTMKYCVFSEITGQDREIFNFPGFIMKADHSISVDVFLNEPEVTEFAPIFPTLVQMGQHVHDGIEALAKLAP